MFVKVYILDAPYAIDRPFDYLCPSALSGLIHSGSLVTVPFGMQNRLRRAVAVELCEQSENTKVKPVHAVLDDRFSLSEEMLGLCLFLEKWETAPHLKARSLSPTVWAPTPLREI